MSIDKIIKNNLVNKNLLESIKDLSKEDKSKLLNIFNFIDKNEKDDQKGIITTDEALNSFLEEIRNSIGEKYDKILDTIGLSHLKNDKNINGIIDIDDFSEEDLIKLESNKLLDIFDIEKFKGQKWTPEFSKIFSAILHNTKLDEKIITTSFRAKGNNRSIIYDVESRTLKKAEQIIDSDRYQDITKYEFDEKGFLKQELKYSIYHYYLKDEKRYAVGSTINKFAEIEGFPALNSECLTEENFNRYKETLSKTQFWDKIEYKYDKNGKIIEKNQQVQIDKSIVASRTVNNITEYITKDLYGNFISHKKYISLIDSKISNKSVTENYNEDGQLISTTTKEQFFYKEPIAITDKNGNNIKISYREQVLKEYPNGRIEKEDYYEEIPVEEDSSNIVENISYEDISFTRDDGYRFDVKHNKNDDSSIIIVTSPSGKSFNLNCQGQQDIQYYYQEQIPKFKNLLENLPAQVLEDLSNEISTIQLLENQKATDAFYLKGSNAIFYKFENVNDITFVHELGHAFDDQKGNMWSESQDFANKFTRLKELADKLINHEESHALDMPAEFFASTYAYFELPENESHKNYIKNLDTLILPLKTSNNNEEKELYELFQELKNDVKIRIKDVRKQPKTQRADNTNSELIKTKLKNVLNISDEYYNLISYNLLHLQYGQSIELSLGWVLTLNDENFSKQMDLYEKYAKNEYLDMYDEHIDLPEEIQKVFQELIPVMKDLREEIKNN